jgi:hypothetical protein
VFGTSPENCSLDQILEVGVGSEDNVEPHFVGVAILVLERTHLHSPMHILVFWQGAVTQAYFGRRHLYIALILGQNWKATSIQSTTR